MLQLIQRSISNNELLMMLDINNAIESLHFN